MNQRSVIVCLTVLSVVVLCSGTAFLSPRTNPCGGASGDEATAGSQTTDALAFYQRNWATPDPTLGPVAACFDVGTPDEVVRFVGDALGQIGDGERYQLTSRWSTTPNTAGQPRLLTWSFVPDGLTISSGVGEGSGPSSLFATLDAKFVAQPNPRQFWISRFEASFARWAEISGLTYQRVSVGGNDWDDGAAWGSVAAAGLRGDLRISMKLIDGASSVLAYNFFPSNGDMVLDKDENWASGGTINRFMRNIITHEHGHGMGLLHCCPISSTKLMEPFLSTSYDGPRHDEIRASHRHYGDFYKNNDSTALAYDVGLVEVGAPVTIGSVPSVTVTNGAIASIDHDGENDYFRFGIAGRRYLRVVMVPEGTTYDSSQQNCSGQTGSCCSGNNVNSLAAADLNCQVIRSDGTTVLATIASSPVGSAETRDNILLPSAGNFYLRVFEGDAPTQSQLYRATLSVRDNLDDGTGTLGSGVVGD